MNLLIITYQGDVSGATNSITYLAKGLADKGHNVYVGCRKESLLFQQLQNTAVELIVMKYKRKFDWPYINHLKEIIIEKNIQIINAQSSWDRYSSIFVRWIFNLKVKVIHTRRQVPLSVGGILQNFLYYRGTDKIVAVSNGVKDDLVKLGLPEHHIKVIHNGTPKEKYQNIDDSVINALKLKHNIDEHELVIGCVSRLKKQRQILKALQILKKKVVLLLVGIESNAEFDTIISSFTVPHRVIFTGSISSEEVLNYYRLFHMHILPSSSEGLSQSLLESMALGVPVIATAAAGNLDLIKDKNNGLLFDDEDIKGLAEKVELLFNDENLRNSLIEGGKKTAFHDFSIENTINRYESFFESLLI